MKSILFLSLLSMSAAACPELQGNYRNCTKALSLERLPGIKISQARTRGAATYEMITEDPYTGVEHREVIHTDGQYREMDEGSDSDIKYKIAYHCENERLHYDQRVEQDQDGETVQIGIEGSLRKLGGKLVMEKSGSVVLDEAGRISVKSDPQVIICE